MTANQINYWKAVWDKERYQRSINEDIRHNLQLEAQNQYSLEEAKRHNIESELIGALQAKASLASASAAQASAAAANRQADARFAELRQQQWVDKQVQSRQDLLAEAEVTQRGYQSSLLNAQAGLTTMQSLNEAKKGGLIEAQTAQMLAQTSLTEQQTRTQMSQAFKNYADIVLKGAEVGFKLYESVRGLASMS